MAQVPTTFEGACQLLRSHCKGGQTTEQTINRLFREQLKHQGFGGDAPYLTAANTTVIQEMKSKQEFAALKVRCRDAPYDSDGPILIVRFAGMDLLIDGHHRCLAWRVSGDADEHTACVVVVAEDSEDRLDVESGALVSDNELAQKKFWVVTG